MASQTEKDKAELASLRAQHAEDPNPSTAAEKSAREDKIQALKEKIKDAAE